MTYTFTLCKHRGKNNIVLRSGGKEGNNLKWVLKSKLAIISGDLEKNIPRREKYKDKVIYA